MAAGPYTVSGTDSDVDLDSGTWTYTLTVSNAITQTSPTTGATTSKASSTFAPGPITVVNNTGAVTFVTTVSSTGLTVSSTGVITTTGTLATGLYTISGTDGDTSGDTGTWTYTLTVSNPSVTVTFNANGGKGTMAVERDNTPTALTINRFTRAGYTFTKWNTAANGSGVNYANGTLYPFKRSTTLYAQWRSGKAVTHSAIFNANGGRGIMAVERDNTPTALTSNRFTRAGYTFTKWNTAANGSGVSYANGATYSFKTSATLYAQWRRHKTVVKPAIDATVTLGRFALKSSTLSASLEAQISNLASKIKTNRDTHIALVGYGDKLTLADELNESLWAANFTLSEYRASAVATYLKQRLAVLGVKEYSITAKGNGAVAPTSGGAAIKQTTSDLVIATLT